MAEVKHQPERKHTVHRALHLLLHHAAVSQPEIATEAKELQNALDEQFLKEPEPAPKTRREKEKAAGSDSDQGGTN
jgi:hypothetical protein